MPKVFVTRRVHKEAIDLLKGKFTVDMYDSDEPVPRNILLEKIKGCDALFCTISDYIDAEVLTAAGDKLKIVATMSVGKHHISELTCQKRNIYISTTPDVAADSAAELTASLLLVTARRCFEGEAAVKNGEWGKWKPMWICGTELTGRTLGILGFGRVGHGVARRMHPFGLKRIIYHDVSEQSCAADLKAEFVDLDTLMRDSDFLVISCALTGKTQNLFNKDAFKKMKNSAILINTARGPIVNTNDLAEALKNGDIHAAGLDVTDPEPLSPSHPLVFMDNCVILPHLGTNTTKARLDMAIFTAKNIISFIP